MKNSPVMLNSFQHPHRSRNKFGMTHHQFGMTHSHFRLTLITTIFLALIPLSSCDNFLKNGQDVKDEVLDAIAYNNAQECTVVFRADAGTGEFLGSYERTYKVGYESQVQFELNTSEYVFKGLKAVSQDDKTVSRADSVEITEISKDDVKGIYKFNVKLLRNVKDVLIYPECILLPKIKEILPKFESNGCDQDSAIQITFNKPVDTTTFDPASISIYSDENLAQYFHAPEFTSDNKTINISSKQLILPPNETKSLLGIDVNYDFTGMKDADGLAITAQGTHSYKINKNFGNRKAANVLVQASSTIGDCLPVGEKEWTVDYFTDIQFTLTNPNYKFVKFAPVISDGTNETPADCVVFQNEAYDDSTGIYKASAKLTKALKDNERLIIRPQCLELPRVVSHTPASATETNFANVPIVINFNMPMEAANVTAEHTLFNYNNISIKATDSADGILDMEEYFDPPVFDAEKKILTLYPKTMDLIHKIGEKPVIQLNISLSSSITVTNDGVALSLKQDNNSSFTVKYKPIKEETAPRKLEENFFVTTDAISLSDRTTLQTCKKFHQEVYSEIQDSIIPPIYDITDDSTYVKKVLQNRATDYIYIYGKYYDADSGVKKVVVKQSTLKTEQHQYYSETEYYVNSPKTDDVEFSDDGNGTIEFCIKHKLSMVNKVYNFEVYVYDASENHAPEETFFVASRSYYSKHTYNENDFPDNIANSIYDGDKISDMIFEMRNEPKELFENDNYRDMDVEDFLEIYNSNLKNIKIYYKHFYLHFVDTIFIHDSTLKIYCEYIDKDGIKRNEEFENHVDAENESGYWSLTLNVDKLCETPLTIRIENPFGVKAEIVKPGNKEKLSPTTSGGLMFIPGTEISDGLAIQRNSQGELSFTSRYNQGSGSISYSNELAGYIYWDQEFFYDYIEFQRQTDSVEVVGTPVIRKDSKNHVCIDFTFADDTWDKFDIIRCYVKIEGRTYPIEYFIFTKDEIYDLGYGDYDNDYCYIILNDSKPGITYIRGSNDRYNEYLFNKKLYFIFAGGSNSYIPGPDEEQAVTVTIDPLDEEDYDDKPPSLTTEQTIEVDDDEQNINHTINRTFAFTLKDNASGPKEATIKYGKKQIVLNEGNNWTYELTLADIKEYLNDCSFDYEYEATDNNNNVFKGTDSILWVEPKETNLKIEYINPKNLKIQSTGIGITYTYPHDYVDAFLVNNGQWKHVFTGTDTYVIKLSNESTDSFENTWVKVSAVKKQNNNNPLYLYKYTGSTSSSEHDFMTANANSKSSAVISSNKPVLVHTFTTRESYEKCKNWSPEHWYQFENEVESKIISFPDENPFPLSYTITNYDSVIEDGLYYVIIAHFANGTTLMSQVMQK